MKKLTSLFVVVLLLAALSLSTFAESIIYGQTTIDDGNIDKVFVTNLGASWDGIVTEDGALDFPVESTSTYYNSPEALKETMTSSYTWQMDMYFYGTELQNGNGSVKDGAYKPYDSAFLFTLGGEKNLSYRFGYNFVKKQYEVIYNPVEKKLVLDPEDQWMLDEKDRSKFDKTIIAVPEELTMNEWHTVVFRVSKEGDVFLFVDDSLKLKLLHTDKDMVWGEQKDTNTGEVLGTFPISIDPKLENADKIFRKFNLQMKMDNIVLANDDYFDYHTFDESKTVTVPAKEFEDGSITKVCANCGETCVASIPAIGCQEHLGGTATCTAKAVCAKCGVKYGQMADHAWGSEVVVVSQATSLKEGRSYVTCANCGAKKYTITVLDPNNPDPSDPIYKDGYVVPGPSDPSNDDNNNQDPEQPSNNNGDQNDNNPQKPQNDNDGTKKNDQNKANPGTSDIDVFGLAAMASFAGVALLIKKRV